MPIQQNLVAVVMITSIAAIGTLFGALISYLIILRHQKIRKNILNFIVALGGGVLIAAFSLVLIPEGMRSLSFISASLVFLCGSLVFMLIDLWIESRGSSASQILANTMDSVPESVGIGAAFATGGPTGLFLAVLVGLQNVTEGFNSYNELKLSGMSMKSNFILQLLSAIAGPIGGVLGFLFLAGHPSIISGVFMFSAGGMLYLIFHDIAPLAHREGHWVPTLGSTVGFVLGLVTQVFVY